jgi:outer membrane protein TolC
MFGASERSRTACRLPLLPAANASEHAIEDKAVETAGRSLEIVQTNYATAMETYSAVLIADMQYHQALISDGEIKAVRYQDTVALFAAIGGG